MEAEKSGEQMEWEFLRSENEWVKPVNSLAFYLLTWEIRLKPCSFVDFGPDDIPTGSVLLYGNNWISIVGVQPKGVSTRERNLITWKELHQQWPINRSIASGKWNPTAWEKCRKEK